MALRIVIYLLVMWVALVWVGRKYTYFLDRSPVTEPGGERLRVWWFETPGAPLATLYCS